MMQIINLLPCVILACITYTTMLYHGCPTAQNRSLYATLKDYGSGCQIAGTSNTCIFKLAENS